MTDSSETRFAGFTRDEWCAAFMRGGTPRNQAYATADVMFRRIEEAGSNGGGLDDETWALLAVASKDGVARVRAELTEFPGVLRRVERLITSMQNGG